MPILLGIISTISSIWLSLIFTSVKPEKVPNNPIYKIFTNEEYNYQIDIPVMFFEEGESIKSKADIVYASPDKKAVLEVRAKKYTKKEPLGFSLKEFKKSYNGDVIWEGKISEKSYAIHMKINENYIYRETLYTKGIVKYFQLTYPVNQEDTYNRKDDNGIIRHIEKSFINYNQ